LDQHYSLNFGKRSAKYPINYIYGLVPLFDNIHILFIIDSNMLGCYWTVGLNNC